GTSASGRTATSGFVNMTWETQCLRSLVTATEGCACRPWPPSLWARGLCKAVQYCCEYERLPLRHDSKSPSRVSNQRRAEHPVRRGPRATPSDASRRTDRYGKPQHL